MLIILSNYFKRDIMKIFLIRPPVTHFSGSQPPVCDLPLGLLYIAGALNKKECQVEIYDAIIDTYEEHWSTKIENDEECKMGAPECEIEDRIRKFNPDIVGITNQFSSQISNAILIA